MQRRFVHGTVLLALFACTNVASGPGGRPGPGPHPPGGDDSDAEPRQGSKRSPPGANEPGKLRGITRAHNQARAAVGVDPLQWSDDLARYAQKWANQLAARGCNLKHRRADRYGENLYWGSKPASAVAVVDEWVAEKAGYDHRKNKCKGTCGHYTQVVWAKSRRLGCGVATCSGAEIWVCNYDPPGNFVGEKPY